MTPETRRPAGRPLSPRQRNVQARRSIDAHGARAQTAPQAGSGRTGAVISRPQWLALGFSAMLLLYGARLYQLQIVRHAEFASQSDSNFQRDEVIRAIRGEIRTRDGVLLATSRMAVDLIYKGKGRDGGPIDAWERIRYLANVPPENLVHGQPREPDRNKEREVVLARNIPADRIAALEEYTVLQPNLELRERLERIYPQGKLAAHLLGYTREANDVEVKDEGYTLGDLVGASGLEYSLQHTLEGKNGVRRVEVTADGRPQGDKVADPGLKGKDLTLTIDSYLQRAAERVLQEGLKNTNEARAKHGSPPETQTRGAVIALDPRTGEVLALASAPAYDPNWFSRTPSPDPAAKKWALLSSSRDAVMQNRAVQQYDSGSVFKPTSTLAYVEKWGNKTFNCATVYRLGGASFKNWAHRNMGPVDGRKAIAYSCNTWFYATAVDAGPKPYSNYLARRAFELGFGRPTGLELVGEKTGLLPSAAEYEASGRKDPTWYPGFSLNMSIGQGQVQVTPAQIASVLSTIVNDGQRRPLTVVRAVNGVPQPLRPAEQVPGRREDFELVKEGMTWTTSLPQGTASTVIGPQWFPVRTGGKTGTAENSESHRKNYAYTNAWYEGYGPLESPNFLVVTFFENGGEGYGTALPAATKMFAARWCLKLDERFHALRGQTPCTGELDQMHRYLDRQAALSAQPAGTDKPTKP